VLTERILEHWRHAEEPAILLSGGYDSQYIFYTIAESIDDTSKLKTVTWGENPEKRYADMDIARRTADHFKTKHIEIIKTQINWQSEYDQMFRAQNGMTDSSFYHAHELSVCKKLRKEYGIKSVMRGDECLGHGPKVSCNQSALKINGMSFPESVPGLSSWFNSENHITEQYSRFMAKLVEKYMYRSYDCLRDTIDFYERQHMNRNPLNYYKLHYLDVFCPLIDADVHEIFCKLPNKYRHNKQLFKKILEEKIGNKLQIAEYNNLTNWEKVISESNEIKSFLINEIQAVSSFLNNDFFCNQAISISKRTIENHKIKDLIRPLRKIPLIDNFWNNLLQRKRFADKRLHIPAYMLVIRAAVLARWSKSWIN
jgi:asparagine synthetase B (glutamine-hydrolysing)